MLDESRAAAPAPGASAGGTGPADSPHRDPWTPWLLLGIAFLASLRLVRLGDWSLWIDEALTYSDAVHQLGGGNPLGYRLFGAFYGLSDVRPDEFTLRLPSALLGVLSLPLAALVFAPAAGRRVALGTALLLGASSWHLYWSQNARFYTLALVLSLAGAALVLRALERDRVLLAAAGLAIAASAALAHPTTAFLLPGLALAAPMECWIARRAGRPGPRRVAALGLALAAAGLLLELFTGTAVERIADWRSKKLPSGAAHLVLTGGFYFTPLLLTGALAGLAIGLRRGSRAVRIAALVVLLDGLVALFLAERARMTAQYIFVTLPWVCFLASYPIAPATVREPGRGEQVPLLRVAYLAVLALPAVATCLLQLSVRAGERPPWREGYRVVFEQRRPDDLVMGMAAAVGEFYLDPGARELRYPRSLAYLDRDRWPIAERWDRTGRRTWFVVNHEELEDWRDVERSRFQSVLREECRMVARFPLIVESRDLSVFVYLRE